jgi:hypothetical protein
LGNLKCSLSLVGYHWWDILAWITLSGYPWLDILVWISLPGYHWWDIVGWIKLPYVIEGYATLSILMKWGTDI